jgi:hypothetical protein
MLSWEQFLLKINLYCKLLFTKITQLSIVKNDIHI